MPGAKDSEKVIHKQHPSSFTGTDLAEHLDKLGKKKIVLVGMYIYTSLPFFLSFYLLSASCVPLFRTRADEGDLFGLV